ncbi:MAG: 1-deoxy-D-xylulose-5-phosphate synthase N-terminal domain-containing protein, partial [Catenulispora sp.]
MTAVPTDPAAPAFFADPAALRTLTEEQLAETAREIRRFLVETVARTGGHLGSNLGAVELTLALHRVYDSPRDAVLWDTGHQAYVHKIVTGRGPGFAGLRQAGGLSGYPSRAESPHDWIENSHASTVLAYAHGLASAFAYRRAGRRVAAVIGDGSMTGGMAFEGLNNLGRSGLHVVVVLNDNGRSYAPTASRLPERLRGSQTAKMHDYQLRQLATALGRRAGVGDQASAELHAFYWALGDVPRPESFFHSLGLAYLGPVDGHSVSQVERALQAADRCPGPVVLHVVTRKGKGYPFAEEDAEKCLHDVSVFDPATGPGPAGLGGFTGAFSQALIACAEQDERIHALTAAMPGPTGLLPFQ